MTYLCTLTHLDTVRLFGRTTHRRQSELVSGPSRCWRAPASTCLVVLQDKQARQGMCKQGQGMRKQGQGTRTSKRHSVQAPGQWHRTCRFRCRLSLLLRLRKNPDHRTLLAASTSLQDCHRARRGRRRPMSCKQYVGWPMAHAHLGPPSSPDHVVPGRRALRLTK